MKKSIILAILIMLASNATEAKRLFIEMKFSWDTIEINDGSTDDWQTLKGNDGKNLKFQSVVSALNYMSLQGWELVGINSNTDGHISSGNGSIDTNKSFFLSKEVSEEVLGKAVEKGYKKHSHWW